MSSATLILTLLLAVEFVARLVLEIRERRLTQMRGGLFAVLRLIPLLNDIVPLPENRKEPAENEFVKKHEEGHASLRHGILRNLAKIALLLLAVWLFAFLLASHGMSLVESILWLHLGPLRLRQARQKGGQGRHAKPRRKRNPVYKIVRGGLPRTPDCRYTQSKDFEQRNQSGLIKHGIRGQAQG